MPVTANFAGAVQTDITNRFRMLQSMARVYLSGAPQSIPNTTTTALSFNTAEINTDGMWTAGSPTKLTAPITGKYSVYGGVEWAVNSTGFRSIFIRKNGTTTYAGTQVTTPTPANLVDLNVSDLVSLSAGEYVEIVLYQNSGGSLDANNARATFLAMLYVGE